MVYHGVWEITTAGEPSHIIMFAVAAWWKDLRQNSDITMLLQLSGRDIANSMMHVVTHYTPLNKDLCFINKRIMMLAYDFTCLPQNSYNIFLEEDP